MPSLVKLRVCSSIEEAVVIKSLLDANDVDAWIDNYYHCTMDWPIVHALGGVSVTVPQHQFIDAVDVIATAESLSESVVTPLKKRHRWRALFLLLY